MGVKLDRSKPRAIPEPGSCRFAGQCQRSHLPPPDPAGSGMSERTRRRSRSARPSSEEEVGQESTKTGSDFGFFSHRAPLHGHVSKGKAGKIKIPPNIFYFLGGGTKPASLSLAAMVFIFHQIKIEPQRRLLAYPPPPSLPPSPASYARFLVCLRMWERVGVRFLFCFSQSFSADRLLMLRPPPAERARPRSTIRRHRLAAGFRLTAALLLLPSGFPKRGVRGPR